MTKTLSLVSHKNYNLNANEGFVILLTSKLITCFVDGFTLETKSQLIAYLLNGSEHIYWSLDLEGEVHSIWDLWISGLQECKGNGFFRSRAGGQKFLVGSIKFGFLSACAQIYLPLKVRRGRFNVRPTPPSIAGFRACTCMGNPPRWKPM